MTDGVLNGIRVVELGLWVAGPAVGGVMADWGANVVKVEPPAGDPMRRVFHLVGGHGQPESPPFDLDNRGKRSVVLDLSLPRHQVALDALIASADVFLTNLRPHAVERLGLGPNVLLERHPELVYTSVSGYGLTGEDAGRAGYDVGAFWARSGIADVMRPAGEAPPAIRGGMGDHATALAALSGTLAALLARARTGRRHVTPLCRAIGREDLLEGGRFADARSRRKNAADFVAELDAVFATASRAHAGLSDSTRKTCGGHR